MDADALAERILLDLKNTFKKDPLIDEFDILPVSESHRNTSPVIHIDHKVALEDWCVKHVYVYAYSKFFTWRKKPYKVDTDSLLMWSSAILLINPEPETVWNARKELVCQNVALPVNELKFSELVLSRKPKSSPVYAHRKWVLLKLMKSNMSSCAIHQVVEHEIGLCTRFANTYPNNYYAWCHRSWVLTHMDGLQHKTVSDELERTEKWASTHVSDHCGLHYRQFLLSCLPNYPSNVNHEQSSHTSATNTAKAKNDPCHITEASENYSVQLHFNDAIKKELEMLGCLQTTYPGHEALWYHRRYILHEIDKLGAVSCERNVHQGTFVGSKIQSSSVDTFKLNLECTNAECQDLSSRSVAHVQSHIVEIDSLDAENVDFVSVEVSGDCSSDQRVCANVGQDERGIVSSIGDIHCLVLDDTESPEGYTQCKRCKMDMDNAKQEQVKGGIPIDDSENICSMDSETVEISPKTPSECKRCKLDCASTVEQDLILEQSRTDDIINSHPSVRTLDGASTMEVSQNLSLFGSSAQNSTKYKAAQVKKHTPKSVVWSLLEEETFLGRLLAKSCEGGWERTLIRRHVAWLSRTLQWSLILS
ncbi:hypothetical protein JTE90_021321 [Oedothorax gibbosus]|uniref:Protein prenyltransferase alpha subunit repeat-containing protein 1 n=1 Tax=Oedothorax gibbosus TaxID=931172 RepID=A0AAV6VPZ0_9ARAC|nr:hypothetical protein JTE90_021321 [Oedothorax gibbosus]